MKPLIAFIRILSEFDLGEFTGVISNKKQGFLLEEYVIIRNPQKKVLLTLYQLLK